MAAKEETAGQLRRELDETRAAKQNLEDKMGADKKQLNDKIAKLEEAQKAVEGKLVVEPYWKWIFAAVVGLGALGWGWGRFEP